MSPGTATTSQPGEAAQAGVHVVEIRHALGADAEGREAIEIFLADVALQDCLLPLEEDAPDVVVFGGVAFEALIDDAFLDRLSGQNAVSGHRGLSRRGGPGPAMGAGFGRRFSG